MFISKEQLKIVQFASKDETRQSLFGVHITDKEAVATDGHRLMVVEHGEPPELDMDKFHNEAVREHSQPPPTPATLSADSIETALKGSKIKKRDHLPCHDWVWLSKDFITVLDANLEPINFPAQWLGGKYPDWKQVLPDPDDQPFKIGLSAKYLSDGDYLADDRSHMLFMHMKDRNHSALITGENRAGQNGRYVVMPMRVDGSKAEADYLDRFHDVSIYHTEISAHVKPINHSNLIDINGNLYLKADLEAFLESRNSAVAV